MDPCPFVRLIVESLALKLPPVASKPAGSGIHPVNTPCFCTLQLQNLPSSASSSTASLKTVPLPLSTDPSATSIATGAAPSPSGFASPSVVFNLDPTALQRQMGKPAAVIVSVYSARSGGTCGFGSGRLLGRVRSSVDLRAALLRPVVAQNGWMTVGKEAAAGGSAARLHLVVRSEPEPRFVFQFGGEPECSPVVYQIHNGGGGSNLRQPVFSCRFSADRRSCIIGRSLSLEYSSSTNATKGGCWWAATFGGRGMQPRRRRRQQQRKGWTVTIHDLSGSPVAAASMVTPFVPSPGSDRVSRSNPGAWLILRPAGPPSATSWKPWGRLEAWRERGPVDALGYRFELADGPTAGGGGGVTVAQSAVSVRSGGEFCIDRGAGREGGGPAASLSPAVVRGFVMESTVGGEGKISKPTVQVGVQHVRCMADAALFVALGAAVDLSMDACRLFGQKLRKELFQDYHDVSS